MLIAVVSDTHRNNYALDQVLKNIEAAEILIHLGDNIQDADYLKRMFKGKVINVRGNCDILDSVKSETIEVIDGKKIFITHGHNYDVKYTILNLKYKALEVGADIVLFGHSHVSMIEYEEGIWFINPGSASIPRDNCKSIALINVKNNEIIPSIRKI